MHILVVFIYALRYNLYEAEREYAVILINLTHTDPVVIIGLEILISDNLTVAVVIIADRIAGVVL